MAVGHIAHGRNGARLQWLQWRPGITGGAQRLPAGSAFLMMRTTMKSNLRSPRPARWAALLLCGACACAHAELGGDVATVAADQAALRATLTVIDMGTYADYRLQLPDGIVVHEFVNAAQRVFEVTWSGKGHKPDMTQLLGPYAGRGRTPARGARAIARRGGLVASDLEIHAAVRNRHFSGTAHLPALLPESMAAALPVPVDSK